MMAAATTAADRGVDDPLPSHRRVVSRNPLGAESTSAGECFRRANRDGVDQRYGDKSITRGGRAALSQGHDMDRRLARLVGNPVGDNWMTRRRRG